MKLSILAGATSVSVNIFIQNNSVSTGAGLTGLAFNTASLTAYYTFAGGNAGSTVINLVTLGSVGSAYASGGFIEIDSTHMPGLYRLDIPNAVLAASHGRSVIVYLNGATNMAPCILEIELTAVDNQNAVNYGMSSLPNTAVTTNGSLITSGTGTDQLSVATGKVLLQATQTGVTIPTVTTVTNQLTGAQIATSVWSDTTAGDFSTTGSPGHVVVTQLGGTFTTSSSSIFSAAALALAPTGGSAPTVSQIATAVWQDAVSGDFTANGSIGQALYVAAVPGGVNGHMIAGTNANTTLGRLTLTDGLLINRSTANTSAIVATGNGTGDGMTLTSGNGATGNGLTVLSNSTNGNGLASTRAGTGHDINLLGDGKIQGSLSGAVGSITGVTFPTNFSIFAIDNSGFVTTNNAAPPSGPAIADAVLGRNIAGGSSGGRTVSEALYLLRNRWTSSGGTLTVYSTDDSTVSWNSTLTSNPSAEPIVSGAPTS